MDRILFDGKVRFLIMGRKYGNFHPEAPGAEARRHSVMRGLGAERVFSPRPSSDGSGPAVILDDGSKHILRLETADPTLIRTTIPSDAGLVLDITTAVAWWGADCPIGVMFNEPNGLLAVPHLGFKNIFRPDGSLPTLPETLRTSWLDAEEMRFWFSGGAGPCCFGYSDPEIARTVRNRFGAKAQPGEVLRGPRRGQYAIDLHHMVRVQAEQLNLSDKDLDDEQICTSCFGLTDLSSDDQGTYWSNLRAPGKKERNGIFVIRK